MAVDNAGQDTRADLREKSANKDFNQEEILEIERQAALPTTRVFVVLNPVAGTGNGSNVRETIQRFCDERRWVVEIHETEKNEDLTGLIRAAVRRGVDMVIASGGDGTVAQVVNGMVNSHVPLGILPSGTGNNLARDLLIPLNLEAALALLAGEYRVATLDVMQVDDNYYVMNASVGISAEIMKNTSRVEKRRFGMLAYLRHAITHLLSARTHRFTVHADGRRYRFKASEIMVANEKFLRMQPLIEGVNIDPSDGRLDVFIVRAQGVRDYLDVVSRFVRRRKQEDDKTVRYLPVEDRLKIDSPSPLPVQADGEVAGKTPIEIRVVPRALKIIVPQPK